MLLSTSKFFCLILPQSITYTTSSIVMDVSAMLVAMTILRTPKKQTISINAKFKTLWQIQLSGKC
jgi:hypothetical protein